MQDDTENNVFPFPQASEATRTSNDSEARRSALPSEEAKKRGNFKIALEVEDDSVLKYKVGLLQQTIEQLSQRIALHDAWIGDLQREVLGS
ncbi:MAG: hypothetical protein P4M05_21585 [Bradyrhizobium sp.]|nr:hypothetical protein [Bradyrhizobium sp.]